MRIESTATRPFMILATIGLVVSATACDPHRKAADPEDEDEDEQIITTAAGSCGVERWAVKTGTDTTTNLVNLTPQNTTIASMRALAMPSSIPSTTRVPGSAETQAWRISATLTEFKLETDSDFHLVLSDASGLTMIAEIPSPSCDAGSVWSTQIAHSRSAMTAKFTPTTSFQTANVPVIVTGVGMFDFAHGQTGAAPNQIELHPVLDICFPGSSVSGCATSGDFTVSAPASLSTAAGASSSATISTASSGGFTGTVALAVSGVPAGASSSLSPVSVAAGGSSTLTLSAGTTAPGSYPVTVTGTSGGLTHSATLTWTISAGTGTSCPASYTLKFNGHSYRATSVDTYPNVVASCHADGEHVVVINDSSENTWALGQLTSSNSFVWIGLHFTSGAWMWDDGTALGSGFEAFSGAPPTNPSNPCVNAHQTDGSWLTFSCTATHPTLCECDGP